MELYEGAINPIGKPRRDAVMVELIGDAVIVHIECVNMKKLDDLKVMAHKILWDINQSTPTDIADKEI